MKKSLLLSLLILALLGCQSENQKEKLSYPVMPDKIVKEKYMTIWNEADNIDSPAFWNKDSLNYLFATAKTSDVIVVYDAETGKEIKRIGKTGKANGELDRPNGIAVFKDFLFVVERDNARLQIFSIPDFNSIGIFAKGDLIKPYGIYIDGNDSTISLYVTDNYETEDELIPPDNQLNKRVWKYLFEYKNNNFTLLAKKSFGDTKGAGVLKIVESICADPVNDNLLIADEYSSQNNIKIYDLNGKFKRIIDGKGLFNTQPEGIVLYECENGNGYWIMTDQDYTNNYFNLFDRQTFKYLGRFKGSVTSNTDGIAITQRKFGAFDYGAFFAVHNDGGVSAFDLKEILDSLNQKPDCLIK